LRAAFGDRDLGVRLSAAWALTEIEGPRKEALAVLLEVLGNPAARGAHPEVFHLLGRFGAAGAPAVGRLPRIVRAGQDGAGRLNAVRALGRIGPTARRAVPALLDLAAALDQFSRREADEMHDAVVFFGTKPAFRAPLRLGDIDRRREITAALARL